MSVLEVLVVASELLDAPVRLADETLDIMAKHRELDLDGNVTIEANAPLPGVVRVVEVSEHEWLRDVVSIAMESEHAIEPRSHRRRCSHGHHTLRAYRYLCARECVIDAQWLTSRDEIVDETIERPEVERVSGPRNRCYVRRLLRTTRLDPKRRRRHR
jgi:hypothetical protein